MENRVDPEQPWLDAHIAGVEEGLPSGCPEAFGLSAPQQHDGKRGDAKYDEREYFEHTGLTSRRKPCSAGCRATAYLIFVPEMP